MRGYGIAFGGGDTGKGVSGLRSNVGSIAIGVVFAAFSAVANGTFTIFSKTNAVKEANVEPLIFNFWACVGIVISSLLFIVKSHLLWTPLGLLSGFFFTLSAANSFRSVKLVGVSVGTGIWCGVSILVSFGGGLLLDPSSKVRSPLWGGIAILIILVGVAGVAYSGHYGRTTSGQEEHLSALLDSQKGEGGSKLGPFASGVLSALIAGVLGGLIMLPLTWADDKFQGANYLPSFGIGVLIFGPLVTFLPYCISTETYRPKLHPAHAALPGIMAGIVWNIGNLLSIIAIGYVGYSVAYPVMQTGIFIAGIWGMLLFDEISGTVAATTYWLSGVVIVAGVGLLTWAAPQS